VPRRVPHSWDHCLTARLYFRHISPRLLPFYFCRSYHIPARFTFVCCHVLRVLRRAFPGVTHYGSPHVYPVAADCRTLHLHRLLDSLDILPVPGPDVTHGFLVALFFGFTHLCRFFAVHAIPRFTHTTVATLRYARYCRAPRLARPRFYHAALPAHLVTRWFGPFHTRFYRLPPHTYALRFRTTALRLRYRLVPHTFCYATFTDCAPAGAIAYTGSLPPHLPGYTFHTTAGWFTHTTHTTDLRIPHTTHTVPPYLPFAVPTFAFPVPRRSGSPWLPTRYATRSFYDATGLPQHLHAHTPTCVPSLVLHTPPFLSSIPGSWPISPHTAFCSCYILDMPVAVPFATRCLRFHYLCPTADSAVPAR